MGGARRSLARTSLGYDFPDFPCLTGIYREIIQNTALSAFWPACKAAVFLMFYKKIPYAR
jgi:hypothetical protein